MNLMLRFKLFFFHRKNKYDFFKRYPSRDIRKQFDIKQRTFDKLELKGINLNETQKEDLWKIINMFLEEQVQLTAVIKEDHMLRILRFISVVIFKKFKFIYKYN